MIQLIWGFYIVFPISVLALVLKILHIEAVFGEGKQDWGNNQHFGITLWFTALFWGAMYGTESI